jgi:SAM-dependent methyltransferase
MELTELQRHWDTFGKTTPLWSILTDPTKQEDDWDLPDFFKTGVEEIGASLDHVRALGLALSPGRALDFGCGIGRLTQALCAHFRESVGVDIAPSMIALARQHNQYGPRCQYTLNQTDDLAQFPDAYFDFIYTARVLQHMQPEYSTRYLREFLRLLAPGGVLVFQVPSEPARPEDRLRRVSSSDIGPLPEVAYRAHITVVGGPIRVPASSAATLTARVRNASTVVWPAFVSDDGQHQIKLGNHWLDGAEQVVRYDDVRTQLPRDLKPGEEIDLPLTVNAPELPGQYTLELDMVQEGVAWFQAKGSASASLRVEVVANALSQTPLAMPTTGPDRLEPRMEMHSVQRDAVVQLLEEHGGEVVDVERDHIAGDDWVEFRYFVRHT